jgi:hypothetical protein
MFIFSHRYYMYFIGFLLYRKTKINVNVDYLLVLITYLALHCFGCHVHKPPLTVWMN